jgi:hypothetical protein
MDSQHPSADPGQPRAAEPATRLESVGQAARRRSALSKACAAPEIAVRRSSCSAERRRPAGSSPTTNAGRWLRRVPALAVEVNRSDPQRCRPRCACPPINQRLASVVRLAACLKVLDALGCDGGSPAELTGGLGGRSIEGMAGVGWATRVRRLILAAAVLRFG